MTGISVGNPGGKSNVVTQCRSLASIMTIIAWPMRLDMAIAAQHRDFALRVHMAETPSGEDYGYLGLCQTCGCLAYKDKTQPGWNPCHCEKPNVAKLAAAPPPAYNYED